MTNNPQLDLVVRLGAGALGAAILFGVVARYSRVLLDACAIVIALALIGWARRGPRR